MPTFEKTPKKIEREKQEERIVKALRGKPVTAKTMANEMGDLLDP